MGRNYKKCTVNLRIIERGSWKIMEKGQRNRVGHFDVLRGIGIVLMIMGHVSFGAAFSKYIHAFHMPLFFFVSGYFHKGEKYVKSIDFIIQKAKTLLIPYTVFVCICQVLHYIYTGTYSITYFFVSYFSSNHNRIDVAGAYWFLLCLFTAEIIFYFIQIFYLISHLHGCRSSL